MPDEDKKVAPERGRALAEQYGLSFFETSAKEGLNVNEVFTHVATTIITDLQKQGIYTNNTRALGSAMTNRSTADGQDQPQDASNIRIGASNYKSDHD